MTGFPTVWLAFPHNDVGEEEIGLVRCAPNHEVEAGGFGERTEIPVSRKQRNPVIDTALSN